MKKKVNVAKNKNTIYVVFARFLDGEWGIADFLLLPYASTKHQEAVRYKNLMISHFDEQFKPYWTKEKFKVIKMTI